MFGKCVLDDGERKKRKAQSWVIYTLLRRPQKEKTPFWDSFCEGKNWEMKGLESRSI